MLDLGPGAMPRCLLVSAAFAGYRYISAQRHRSDRDRDQIHHTDHRPQTPLIAPVTSLYALCLDGTLETLSMGQTYFEMLVAGATCQALSLHSAEVAMHIQRTSIHSSHPEATLLDDAVHPTSNVDDREVRPEIDE